MKTILIAATLLALVAPDGAEAQDFLYPDYAHKGKPSFTHGQGSRSCGTFIRDNNENPGSLFQDLAWVQGHVDGLDVWNPYSIKYWEHDGLKVWLVNYCNAHPLEMLVNAANSFYLLELGGRVPMLADETIWRHAPSYGKAHTR